MLVYGVPPVSHVSVRHASGETSGEQGPDDVLADWLTLLVIRCLSGRLATCHEIFGLRRASGEPCLCTACLG